MSSILLGAKGAGAGPGGGTDLESGHDPGAERARGARSVVADNLADAGPLCRARLAGQGQPGRVRPCHEDRDTVDGALRRHDLVFRGGG